MPVRRVSRCRCCASWARRVRRGGLSARPWLRPALGGEGALRAAAVAACGAPRPAGPFWGLLTGSRRRRDGLRSARPDGAARAEFGCDALRLHSLDRSLLTWRRPLARTASRGLVSPGSRSRVRATRPRRSLNNAPLRSCSVQPSGRRLRSRLGRRVGPGPGARPRAGAAPPRPPSFTGRRGDATPR